MNKILEKQIEQSLKVITEDKGWCKPYEEQAKVLSENKSLLDQFSKEVKEFDGIQFYLMEVNPTPSAIFKIQARYQGQPIATVIITKDSTLISTEGYEEGNKRIYNCEMLLNNMNLTNVESKQFLTYFNKDMKPKGKINEESHINSMLLAEFRQDLKWYEIISTVFNPVKSTLTSTTLFQ